MTIHPCFDGHEHSAKVGRIHLPLVGSCNIKCTYCNRKMNCQNENRPGLAQKILSNEEALETLNEFKDTNLKIVGVAGPGDPFSNPEKLIQFVTMLREKSGTRYEVCISTNGLNTYKYIKTLMELEVKYITLTINSIDVFVLEKLVEWINLDGVIYKGIEAAKRLNEAQMKSLRSVIEAGMNCKVNTVIVPEVNQYEVINLLKFVKHFGAVKSNLIPLIPVEGTRFEKIHTLSVQEYNDILNEAEKILGQVKGCKKCRADAIYVHKIEKNIMAAN